MKKDKSKIPYGYYCYEKLEFIAAKNACKIIGQCPYWSIRNDKPEQLNGYCSYMEKGDWEICKERKWVNPETGEEVELDISLIWDQCKECGINEPTDDDEEYFKSMIPDEEKEKLEGGE
jgi:hypothetical protein